jgi:hypothetical protein
VLVDKLLVSHELVGTREGHPLGLLAPAVLFASARAILAGHRQGRTGPNPFVFGATHVIRDGELVFAWIDDDYNDHPGVEVLLTASAG